MVILLKVVVVFVVIFGEFIFLFLVNFIKLLRLRDLINVFIVYLLLYIFIKFIGLVWVGSVLGIFFWINLL